MVTNCKVNSKDSLHTSAHRYNMKQCNLQFQSLAPHKTSHISIVLEEERGGEGGR